MYLLFLALDFSFLVTIESNGTSHILVFIQLVLSPGVERLTSSPIPSGVSGMPSVGGTPQCPVIVRDTFSSSFAHGTRVEPPCPSMGG